MSDPSKHINYKQAGHCCSALQDQLWPTWELINTLLVAHTPNRLFTGNLVPAIEPTNQANKSIIQSTLLHSFLDQIYRYQILADYLVGSVQTHHCAVSETVQSPSTSTPDQPPTTNSD